MNMQEDLRCYWNRSFIYAPSNCDTDAICLFWHLTKMLNPTASVLQQHSLQKGWCTCWTTSCGQHWQHRIFLCIQVAGSSVFIVILKCIAIADKVPLHSIPFHICIDLFFLCVIFSSYSAQNSGSLWGTVQIYSGIIRPDTEIRLHFV